MSVTLTAPLIEAFAGTFLSIRYDNPRPTPPFHRQCWAMYASSYNQCVVVAPRNHAKSTSLTFDYILAEVCFRVSDYVILIGSTEDKSAEQLSNISEELHTNHDLRREFGIQSFESDQKTEIIVVCDDGHRFRILARGAEQKIRGAMWKGKRPNLIVCDDMEDDEQVANKDRRKKFRDWFFRAAKQSLSRSGKIRVHGTILHEDSLLARLIKNNTWKHLFFKAHESYNDFSNVLWPEQWSASALRVVQQEFEENADSAGYSQEYLNTPLDNNDAYLRPDDFIPMTEEDHEKEKLFYVAGDFAISKNELRDATSFTIGGRSLDNLIHIVDERTGRWESNEWVEEIFLIDSRWNPQVWFVEDGSIWKTIYPIIVGEMRRRDHYINFQPMNPTRDKAVRGRPLQKRMRGGGIHFDTEASWYPAYKQELTKFTGGSQATHDDQFDSTAWLIKGIEDLLELEEDDFQETSPQEEAEDEWNSLWERNAVTGY